MPTLIDRLHAIAAESGAEMGIAVRHIESGQELLVNADRPFPMCSVLKIPVLCEAFRQIDAGRFTLDDRWELTHAEKNVGSGILSFLQDGLTPTVRDLLTLMIIISDNTATDMVVHRIGVENVQALMRSLGLTEIHFAMDIRGIFDALFGDPDWSDPIRLTTDLSRPQTAPPMDFAGPAFSIGPDNNVSTPRDMTRLLSMIFRGEVVNRQACDGMLEVLLQQTLNQRLPRYLPFGVPFAHKTGTLPGVRNDAGVLYAGPESHVAVTVFSSWDFQVVAGDKEAEWAHGDRIDHAIGRVGAALYEEFAPTR